MNADFLSEAHVATQAFFEKVNFYLNSNSRTDKINKEQCKKYPRVN